MKFAHAHQHHHQACKTAAAACVMAMLAAATGCGLTEQVADTATQRSDSNSTVLRIGAQPYPLYSDVFVAHELGYLTEELEAVDASYTWNSFKSGPLVNEAAASGSVDAGFMADLPAIIARSTGQDIEIISNVAYGERALAVLVPSDSTLQSVGELKGKKVAYATGSYAEHLLALLLSHEGLKLSDVDSVNLSAEDQAAAIQNGSVDAIVIWEQYVTKLVSDASARVLADGTGVKRGNMVTYVTSSFCNEHPDVVRAYNTAVQRGADLIESDPKQAADAVADDFGVTPELLEEIWKNLTFTTSLNEDDISEIEKVEVFALEQGIIKNDVDISQLVSTKYADKE